MLFNSLDFAVFFPLVTLCYFLISHRYRWFLLLVASCIFYMAFIPAYILILLVTILIDYFAGIWIEKSTGKKRKMLLIVSIVSTCLVLFVFKYFNFFIVNVQELAQFLHWNYNPQILNIILPIGLSFHTFQSLAYVIEVYRGNQKAEHHFGIYALYVMFYPQLVAGPIERPQNLLHQFYEPHEFEYRRVVDGLKLMAVGLAVKIIIADRLAILVNRVYGSPYEYSGVILAIATVAFAFQIYCDFMGYSTIAIGAAQVMGFRLMKNFERPYLSKSISEFWKRWHISLSSWFRDYLYVPLGGNRVSKMRNSFNLLFTFLISGLWHGANWTYVVWGGLNGLYLLFSRLTEHTRAVLVKRVKLDTYPRIHATLQTFTTFVLICFAWIFFRAKNMGDAFHIITHIAKDTGMFLGSAMSGFSEAKDYIISHGGAGFSKNEYFISAAAILILLATEFLQQRFNIGSTISAQPVWVRWGLYYTLILAIIFFGKFSEQEFIYFQF